MAKKLIDHWHILIVEDEPDGQEIAVELLDYFDISADLASTAKEALNLLAHNRYTAAIIDLMLPDMDGLELSRAIRGNDHTSDLPCIAITAYHSSVIKKKASDAGFDGFYPKPLDYEGFMEELTRICLLRG